MAIVINPRTRTALRVKNLGWLLKNQREITQFFLLPYQMPGGWTEGFLVAHTRDGRVYVTSFGSFDIARNFLNRPVFKGLPLTDGNDTVTIGGGTPVA